MRGLSLHSRPIRDFDFRLEWLYSRAQGDPELDFGLPCKYCRPTAQVLLPKGELIYRKPSLACQVGVLEFPGATNLA